VVILTYVLLLVLVGAGTLPVSALLAFVTMPTAIRTITLVLRDYENDQKLMKALGLNVIVVLAVPFLVSLGTVIGSLLRNESSMLAKPGSITKQISA
jgi:1,4-dihydroxy-2-naphthoate octaprenyltransferase